MIVFIKQNEIVTETSYTEEQLDDLLEKNFVGVQVPDGIYKYTDFEFINGEWKLKEIESNGARN